MEWIVGLSLIIILLLVVMVKLLISHQASKQMLKRQIQLTDAYAWEVESNRYMLTDSLNDLKKNHEQSVSMNQDLETKIKHHMLALQHQAQKITEYHFFNAHTLRAPVARILGLISIMDSTALSDNNRVVMEMLVKESRALDQIVHHLQQTLYCAESNSPNQTSSL